jgi:thiol-disulfide isomerase/thioredoxin
MQRRPLLLALAAVAWARDGVAADARLEPWKGKPEAPPIALHALDGTPMTLADLRGKVVVVNFWATWCEPCVEEMPSMQRLRDRLAARPFEILAVNHQEGAPRIRSFLEKVRVGFPIVRDTDGAVARAWKVRIFPSSFVVDAKGKIRYQLVGSTDWTTSAIDTRLRALLRDAG